MALFDFWRFVKNKFTTFREFGSYNAAFSTFGEDPYKSEVVRYCVRPLAEFTGKAHAKCSDKNLERILNYRPNRYMCGQEFLEKIRTMYEMRNNVFMWVMRDDKGKVSEVYPVPFTRLEALETVEDGRLFIRFYFHSQLDPIVVPWEDLVALRKDYYRSDITGEDNTPILETLDMLKTVDQGTSNAIKSTANVRGIIKSTKAMLKNSDLVKQRDQFVESFMSMQNGNGIAALDSTQEFIPVKMEPKIADKDQRASYVADIQRYFGVNDKVIMSMMTPDEIEGFYELRVEPFLTKLSNALTSKIYGNGKLLAYDNWIVYEANKLQFASLTKKISMYKEVVLYGGMTRNEWRSGCNMSPLEGGDKIIMRKDAGFEGEE